MTRPKVLHVGGTLYWVICTRNPDSMVLKDADSTPTVAVRKNGASVGDSVTVTKRSATTGIYDCSYNPAGEVEGDEFTIEESATVTGTTTGSATYANSWEFTILALERGTDSGATSAQALDIQSRLPASLDSGNMRSSVQSMAANVLTAAALASDAVTEIQSGLATSAEIADVPTVSEFNARTIAAADYATSTALATVAQYLDTEIQDILTDTGTTLPAQITSAFTEIKGAGWTSTTDTLEKIAESAGGGGTSIMVTPVVAQTPVRVVGSNISTFIGDLSTIRIGVFSGSDPVDLTAFGDLEVCVQQKNGTDLDFVEMADLTIDGDDNNYISWEPSGPSVADVTRGKWSLRKASNKQVIAYGAWIVEDAALEDVGS